ncbi:polyamine aminopropyltransferase [Limnochorda pilosa]|uniref:hypothetical protein n=1 Tax=Limnochorda pilosa TaxID=1555112 RepID=UPI0011875365|nr:hypothetical protein [Limnochorda pilosa]
MVGVFLTSCSLLLLQISLTRLLSVVLSYHYVFAVISLSLLGLGAGGILTHFLGARRSGGHLEVASPTSLAFLLSLFTAGSVFLVTGIARVDPSRVPPVSYFVLLSLPFLVGGALMAQIFRSFPRASARLYAADLVGSAAGSVGAILALDALGPVGAAFLAALMASVAALLFAVRSASRPAGATVASAVLALVVAVLLGVSASGAYRPAISMGTNPEKEIHDALHGPLGGEIVETRWSSFGRTDVVRYREDTGYMDLYLDGTAGTPMYRFNGETTEPDEAVASLRLEFPGYFPFFFLGEQRRNALIIGPGGGRDVLLARMAGIQRITAVEVNPDLVDLVRSYEWYNGGIYTGTGGVEVIVQEGRHFLKRTPEKYDVIMLSLPVTNTSRSPEGYALTENFLLTTDSVRDYLEALTEEGQLVVVAHDEAEILRALVISLVALEDRGRTVPESMKQVYVLGSFPFPVFVLRNSAFDPDTSATMYRAMHRFGYSPRSSYFPYLEGATDLNQILLALARGGLQLRDLEAMVSAMGYDISPVTDDRPFFFKLETGLPKQVLAVFGFSLVLLVTIALLPLLMRKGFAAGAVEPGSTDHARVEVRTVLLFAMIGIGFMLVEIALSQQFTLLIGKPTLALAVLLFSLLVGAGGGSLLSARVAPGKIEPTVAGATLSVALGVLVFALALPAMVDHLLSYSLPVRILASAGLVMPLGFAMGFPFPLGVRRLGERGAGWQVPWMWGVNGASSVFGSVAAIVAAMSLGFREVLLLASGCYLVVSTTARSSRRPRGASALSPWTRPVRRGRPPRR